MRQPAAITRMNWNLSIDSSPACACANETPPLSGSAIASALVNLTVPLGSDTGGPMRNTDELPDSRTHSSGRPYGDRDYEKVPDASAPRSYGTYPTASFGTCNGAWEYPREWSSESWRVPPPRTDRKGRR